MEAPLPLILSPAGSEVDKGNVDCELEEREGESEGEGQGPRIIGNLYLLVGYECGKRTKAASCCKGTSDDEDSSTLDTFFPSCWAVG